MLFSYKQRSLFTTIAPTVLRLPFLKQINGQEDCLTVDVARPAGTRAGDKLPVLFWIYGGGYTVGSTQSYEASGLLRTAVENDQPFIYVAVNYRLGGFGFLPGKEMLESGNTNLGLLDQRLALQWVADNVESFGGDASKVTIWGESAGAMSVMSQMLLYGGDAKYRGKPLFRGAIMDSGTVAPADPVDSRQAQFVYDAVVQETGCSGAADTLTCLREAPYANYLHATRTLPTLFSFNAVAISYLPRPDGTVIPESGEQMVKKGQFYSVPAIFGDQEDEGTIFSLHQRNVSTADDMVEYLSKNLLPHAPTRMIKEFVDFYEPAAVKGSPFRTSIFNDVYPGYKRVAAILGDAVFTGLRRAVQNKILKAKPKMPFWAYHSTFDHGFPVLGTFHGTDIFQLFTHNANPNHFVRSCRTYYFNFLYNLDPNKGVSGFARWPQWKERKELMWFKSRTSNGLIKDDFRSRPFKWIEQNMEILRQ